LEGLLKKLYKPCNEKSKNYGKEGRKMAHDTELMLRLFGFFAIFSFGTLALFIAQRTYISNGYDATIVTGGLVVFIILAVVFAIALFMSFMGWIGKREWKPGEEDWRKR
jgi:hypothetical protein